MTSITKNTTIVFAFAALLMAMPLATSSVYATSDNIVTGNANVNDVCGIDVNETIDFGNISPGTTPAEKKVTITTDKSTVDGITISATTTDWIGTDKRTTADLLHTQAEEIQSGVTVTVSDGKIIEVFTAKTNPSVNDVRAFDVSGNSTGDFIALQTAIDKHSNIVTVDTSNSDNSKIVLVSKGSGNRADAMTINITGTSITSTAFIKTGEFLSHLAAEVTRFAIDEFGVRNPLVGYASKTPLDTTSVDLTKIAGPNNNVDLYLQITADNDVLENLPYTGTLTQQLTFTISCLP